MPDLTNLPVHGIHIDGEIMYQLDCRWCMLLKSTVYTVRREGEINDDSTLVLF